MTAYAPPPDRARPRTLRLRLRALGYQVFYRLPQPVRNRIVRWGTRTYVVGAVVLVWDADTDRRRLLLLRQPPGRGWGLPAGLLSNREEPAVGAARELAEETGIVLDPQELTEATPNALVHARGWIDLVFEANVPASKVTLTVDGAEVWEAAWHEVTALPPMTTAAARLLARYDIGASG
ncbi:NUDIX hydrolase [Pilimelia columellifera]|uniref:NUDIX domain-containing protein n=1 Tax=Pilimelia columellifera subsp. columellifera TaxID=706583 RepID=A0ABN3NE46_9ACTN